MASLKKRPGKPTIAVDHDDIRGQLDAALLKKLALGTDGGGVLGRWNPAPYGTG